MQEDDPATFAMICKADTIGTFQIESRAQMSMLPRLKPKEFLRSRHPGRDRPARPDPGRHGPSLSAPARRQGEAGISKPELKRGAEKTLGVPLFQEQAMKVAIVGAGFTPAEADALRRSMATFKSTGGVSKFPRQDDRRHDRQRGYSAISPSAPSSRSRASAATAFPKATPPASPRSPTPRPG
jgi:error-prone DNA polymerase